MDKYWYWKSKYSFVTNVGSNRITLSDANNNAFNFSTNGQGPILVETEQVAGVHDDYYALTGSGATSFTLQGSGTIPARELEFTNSNVIEDGGEYYINVNGHGLGDGSIVTYSVVTGSAPGGLTGGNQYYAIVVDANYIQLASTQSEWSGRINAITGTQGVSSSYKLFVFSVSGRVASTGTVAIASSDGKVVEGTSTKFSSTYKIGDRFNIVSFGSTVNQFVTREITSIVSDTSLALDGSVGFVTTGHLIMLTLKSTLEQMEHSFIDLLMVELTLLLEVHQIRKLSDKLENTLDISQVKAFNARWQLTLIHQGKFFL